MSDKPFETAAASYAAKGIHVFPCGGDNRKRPLTEHGFLDATTNPDTIADWVRRMPSSNIGIHPGPSGYLVIDVDPKNGGDASWEKLKAEIPGLNQTRAVRTGSGGLHVYFKMPEGVQIGKSEGLLGVGIDTRGFDGYVIVPPSIHINGNRYEWLDTGYDFAPAPAALIERLQTAKRQQNNAKLAEDGEKIYSGSGKRYIFLWGRACGMRSNGDDEASIYEALAVLNQNRLVPPKPDEIVAKIAHDVATRYTPGWSPELTEARRKARDDWSSRSEPSTQPAARSKLDLIRYQDVVKEDIDWLWAGRIAYRKFQLLIGYPGKTKTYLSNYIAAMVTTGRPLPDDYLNLNPEPHDVLLLTYEDGYGDTIRPRLEKCGADLSRVFTIPVESDAFSVKDLPALKRTLEENRGIRLVVIDPVQNMMIGVDSKSDEEVRQSLNPLLKMAEVLGVAVLGIKHLNKDESKSIDSRVGGSIGYAGMARSILLAGHDNERGRGPNGETRAGVLCTKGNLYGANRGLIYEVTDRGLRFEGVDDSLTVERLLPLPPQKKKREE